MKNIQNILFFIGLLFISSQSNSQNFIGEEADINAILLNIKEFQKSVMNSDYQAIGMAYTQNTKIFPSDMDII